MKQAIIKIIILFVILGGYCVWETAYLSDFISRGGEMTEKIANAQTLADARSELARLEDYYRQHRLVLQQISSRSELEIVEVEIGECGNYLARGALEEAAVSAGQISAYLRQITG